MLGERRARNRAATADSAATVPPAQAAAVPGAGSAWRDPVTWAIAAAVFGAYFTISLFRLLRDDPASWDLGIYTEYVKQLSLFHAPIVDVRGPGLNLLGDHFQIAVGVIAPLFRLFPTPATLLLCQAACAAVSVFPVVSAGTALAGRGTGRLIGFGYGFSWGLQQMVEYDFHEIALAVPLLAFSLSALVRGRVRAAALWALPLVFVKEDQGFTVAAIGALLIVTALAGTPGRLRGSTGWGALLVVWGLFWSVLAITVIIPHFNAAHDYYYWKDGGAVGDSPFSVSALVAQAAQGLPAKLPTVFLLLLPTAFLAVGSPVALVAVPSLALRFISTNTIYWGTAWHYNATVMPILFAAAIDALARWRAARPARTGSFPALAAGWSALRAGLARHGAAMMAAVAVALAFQFPLNSLWQGSTYRTGPHAAASSAAMARVPDGATVQATLDVLAPLAARTDTFWIGNWHTNPLTQYVVFDGLDSGFGSVGNVAAFIGEIYPHAGYRQVFTRDGVYVFRRAYRS